MVSSEVNAAAHEGIVSVVTVLRRAAKTPESIREQLVCSGLPLGAFTLSASRFPSGSV